MYILGHLPCLLEFLFVTPTSIEQALSPVSYDTDMNAEVILFWSRSQCKWVPFQFRHCWAFNKNVLSNLHLEAFFHHLELDCLEGMNDHLQ